MKMNGVYCTVIGSTYMYIVGPAGEKPQSPDEVRVWGMIRTLLSWADHRPSLVGTYG